MFFVSLFLFFFPLFVFSPPTGLLRGFQELRRVWEPEKTVVPEAAGAVEHVDEVQCRPFRGPGGEIIGSH